MTGAKTIARKGRNRLRLRMVKDATTPEGRTAEESSENKKENEKTHKVQEKTKIKEIKILQLRVFL